MHLGIVHCWNLEEANVTKSKQMITQMAFLTLEELQQTRDTLETWSQKCLDGLEKMTNAVKSG